VIAVLEQLHFVLLPFLLINPDGCVIFPVGTLTVTNAVAKNPKGISSDVLDGRFFFEEPMLPFGRNQDERVSIPEILNVGFALFFPSRNSRSWKPYFVSLNQLLVDVPWVFRLRNTTAYVKPVSVSDV